MLQWNVADMVELIADSYPGRESLVVDGGPRLTWGALDERASRLANHFLEVGIGSGEHVACYCKNGNEYLETMLACFKARMVPINVNWRYRESELKYLLDDADVVACVVDAEFVDLLERVAPDLPGLSYWLVTGRDFEQAIKTASSERPFVGERSGDDRYFLYTGGTTGYPKGVEWRQEDIIGAVWKTTGNIDMTGSPEQVVELASKLRTRYFAIPPFMHGAAHWGAMGTWLAGGTVLCMRSRGLEPAAALRFITVEKPNFALIVGDAFAGPLLRELDSPSDEQFEYDISSLRVLVSSGAPLSRHYKEAFEARNPRLIIADTLGSSESGIQAIARWQSETKDSRFVLNDVTAILNEETLEPVQPGQVGMLAKSGYLPMGYYKDAEKSRRTFPVINGKRWVLTGDHAMHDEDGLITFLGRGSNCINTGGEKVYPEEVEEALKSHPSVRDCLVVGIPDDRLGSAVTAVVEADEAITLDDIAGLVGEKLAGYKVPRHLVVVDSVPRAPSGKPDYEQALELALGDSNSG